MEENKTIITCKRAFPHNREKVFAAFLDAGKVKQWFGPKEFSIGEVILQPIAGGRLDIEMITPKGDRLWVRGKYTTIEPEETIAYTFMYEPDMPGLGETLVTFHFASTEAGTEVSLVHTIHKPINPAGRTKGWEDGFDKMEHILLTEQ